MFTIFTEEAFPHLACCRLNLLRNAREAPTMDLQSAVSQLHAQARQSSIWVNLWTPSRNAEGKTDLNFNLRKDEQPKFSWVSVITPMINKDGIENELLHLTPVAQPHNIETCTPFAPYIAERLNEFRAMHHFSSNWWIDERKARKLCLTRKKCSYALFVDCKLNKALLHVSQFEDPSSILCTPFALSGSPLLFPEIKRDRAARNSLNSLYVTRKQAQRIQQAVKPNARPVTVQAARNYNFEQRPSIFSRSDIIQHFYNIADVKFPPTMNPSSICVDIEQREAAQPGVPLDGVSGEPLHTVDALVNYSNISRHVWFEAKKLLELGARCSINAIPVVVKTSIGGDSFEYFHVDDFVNPKAVMACVGKYVGLQPLMSHDAVNPSKCFTNSS